MLGTIPACSPFPILIQEPRRKEEGEQPGQLCSRLGREVQVGKAGGIESHSSAELPEPPPAMAGDVHRWHPGAFSESCKAVHGLHGLQKAPTPGVF